MAAENSQNEASRDSKRPIMERALVFKSTLTKALDLNEKKFRNQAISKVGSDEMIWQLGPYFVDEMPAEVNEILIGHDVNDSGFFRCGGHWTKWSKRQPQTVWPTVTVDWRKWVKRVGQDFGESWRKLGIYDAIMISTIKIEFDRSLLAAALCFWSSATNTLDLQFGAMSPTLIDVAAIIGLQPHGRVVDVFLADKEFEVDLVVEAKKRREQRQTDNVFNYTQWIVAFNESRKGEEERKVSKVEHVAFLAYWLCKYMLCTASGKVTQEYVRLAEALGSEALLTSGELLALGPFVLAHLYRCLHNIVTQKMDPITGGPLWIFQLWLQTYFPKFRQPCAEFSSNMTLGLQLASLKILPHSAEECFNTLFEYKGLSREQYAVCFGRSYPRYLAIDISQEMPEEKDPKYVLVQSIWKSALLMRDLYWGSISSTRRKNKCGMELYFSSFTSRQFGYYQALPAPVPESSNNMSSLRAQCNDERDVRSNYNTYVQKLEHCTIHPRVVSCESSAMFKAWWENYVAGRFSQGLDKSRESALAGIPWGPNYEKPKQNKGQPLPSKQHENQRWATNSRKRKAPSTSTNASFKDGITGLSESWSTCAWRDENSTSKFDHDVFLSFRGDDTRKGFTDHLYYALKKKGINTFRDAESLRKGEAIGPELVKAIEVSRFAVVILSKDYATSKWCLDELAHIMTCKEARDLKVYPVFYDIKPSQVRYQTGKFYYSFATHEATFKDKEKLKIWRKALTTIANTSGWDLCERHEAEIIQEIAKEISNILNYYTFLIAKKDLVGMNNPMQRIKSYLALGSIDVRIIGIWGMGGIGKTTLAQEVFKSIRDQFDASAFVANVREECKKVNGLIYLQRLLCGFLFDSDEIIQNVDLGINLMSRRLLMKKVLIILDDVDEFRQLEALVAGRESEQNFTPSLGSGSVVIITTRDEHLLKTSGVHYIYEAEILGEDEAFELFCRKAFQKLDAPAEYRLLPRNFVKYASGLPLALEVLGSNLYGRNIREWSAAYARLDGGPGKDILGVLQTSFDGLEDTEKKIFLDIACFFKGEDQDRVKRILESCGFYPEIGIRVLIDKSLIKIERNKLWMHDLLQQLGWRIVHQESSEHPGKRSRLWVNENYAYTRRWSWLDEVLTGNMGTHTVESMFLSLPAKEEIRLNGDPFQNMANLRLLKICNADFSGSLKFLSRKLRVLEWHEFHLESLPASFQPDQLVEHELVELKMPNSRIKQLWNERLSLKMLFLMDLSFCNCLTTTPDFSNVPNLEELILEGCERLSELHPTIWGLQRLVLLNLNRCVSLESLPHSIGLKSLKTFSLSGCSKLNEFPENVRNMSNLLELHVDGTAIKELPVAIQHFSGLTLLNLRGCENLLNLPNALCSLTSLKHLYLSGCPRIDRLPQYLGSLQHLEELDIAETAITKLPSSFSLLKKQLRRFRGCKGMLT